MSLEQFMSEVDAEVQAEVAAGRKINEDEFAERLHTKSKSKGVVTKQLQRNEANLETASASPMAKNISKLRSMSQVRKNYTPAERSAPVSMLCCDSLEAGPLWARMPHARGGGAPLLLESMSASMAEDYKTAENEITYEQSARMVQKSIARNFAKKK